MIVPKLTICPHFLTRIQRINGSDINERSSLSDGCETDISIVPNQTTFLCEPVVDQCFREIECPGEIDINDLLPFIRGNLLDR